MAQTTPAPSGIGRRPPATGAWSAVGAAHLPSSGPGAVDDLAPYQPQVRCDPTSKPGVRGFRNIVLRTFPATRDLGIVRSSEAHARIGRALDALAGLERHAPSGMFYNWYDPATGAKLTTWPVDGSPVYPFLSTVDNGWLAAALLMVRNAVPQLAGRAAELLAPMDFGAFYDPAAGLLRGGFWVDPPGITCTFPDRGVLYTCHHYGTLNTEPRIASYLGIAFGQVPASHYFRMWRTFPDTCDWGWQEQQPQGVTRTYLGVDVFEGSYGYRGKRLVPSWGGSMFEALMVTLLVPESRWGPRSRCSTRSWRVRIERSCAGVA